MPGLVALDLPAGPDFVDYIQRAWDRGDAVLPVDQRLPDMARRALLAALRPTSIVDGDGDEHNLSGGQPIEPGDALVVATSGSSGPPKGVVLTHGALAAHAWAVHEKLEVDRACDRWLACLPLAHVGGLGVLTRALITGVGLDVLPGFDVDLVGQAPLDLGTTLVSLVPTALDRLGQNHGFRWVVLGGSGDTVQRPANVTHTYGMTETGGGVWYSSTGLKDGPLEGTELRIMDGEIEVRGPTLLRCYRDGIDPKDDDGWLRTGDLGSLNQAGLLSVSGRSGELIISGGENVWPAAVEAALIDHPAIDEVAVAGELDPEWGQRVVAYVVVKPDLPPPTLEQVRDLVRNQVAPFAAPRELRIVQSIPRTALGKIARHLL